MSPNRKRHAEEYRKLGQFVTAQEQLARDWRVALGQSPNPWAGDKSQTLLADVDVKAGPQVMQIVTRTRLSKIQIRSITSDD